MACSFWPAKCHSSTGSCCVEHGGASLSTSCCASAADACPVVGCIGRLIATVNGSAKGSGPGRPRRGHGCLGHAQSWCCSYTHGTRVTHQVPRCRPGAHMYDPQPAAQVLDTSVWPHTHSVVLQARPAWRAKPKSHSFIRPSRDSSTFSGFTSRWMICAQEGTQYGPPSEKNAENPVHPPTQDVPAEEW